MANKGPRSVVDYTFNWSTWLPTGDTIDTASATTVGVTKESTTNDDTTVTVWVSGGKVGQSSEIECEIVTVGGRTEYWTRDLNIKERR